MKTLIQLLLFLFILSTITTCVRKSGRKQSDNIKPQTTEIEQDRQSRTKRLGGIPASQSKSSNQRKITGSEIFSKYNSAVFMVFTSDGHKAYQGSGFFVSASGIGVSNYHVFEGTTIGYEQIKLSDNRNYKIKNIVARNKEDDFIVFQVESKGDRFNCIPIEDKQLKVGEKVFAIGSPRGLENTFSSGEISQVRGDNLIQISVPIDRGSSGGALINEYGNVIGITTGGYDDSGANLNFAVNINVIKPYLP